MDKSKKTSRRTLPLQISSEPAELKRALAHIGLFSRVATELGKSPTHVLEVAKGKRQSSHVVKAIIAEVRRIERHAASQEMAA